MPARLVATSLRHPEPPAGRSRGGWLRHRRLLTGSLAVVLALALVGPLTADLPDAEPAPSLDLAARVTNPVTPGNFTGYGFDQCETQSQATMDAWLQHSPFLAVGVYISGNSRACKVQKLLTPTWIATQLANGWKILPITLGPQSTCVGRFPRYGKTIDPTIATNPTDGYLAARNQGTREANRAVAAAKALGLTPGSTLWYDIEGWSDYRNATCRESALSFLSAWTVKIRKLGFVSGVYSSAGSGMRILDEARASGRRDVTLPSQIWLARYDNKANTSATQYISDKGWPKARVKQYTGGHDETWGGVKINIDRNFLNLGNSTPAGENHCSGVRIDLRRYAVVKPTTRTERSSVHAVKALQCLLRERGVYPSGPLNGNYGSRTQTAVKAWQKKVGLPQSTTWRTRDWLTVLSVGGAPVMKIGSRGPYVRRAQRAIQAAIPKLEIQIDGLFDAEMANDVKAYRAKVGLTSAGIVNADTWAKLQTGRY